MEDKQIFEMILQEMSKISDDIEMMKSDIENIKCNIYIFRFSAEKIENRTLNTDLVLENETNKRLKKLEQSHTDLLQIIYSKTKQIEKIETELSQIKGYVQNIQKVPNKKGQ